ncbi:MAG TPA: hypothetical protein VHZ04_03545 [Candidatus Paceibacterota bacterium]|jgi:hypothetical protein|nr:hypothetical protein [Candidatus Paceibacterota bacterium]
MPKVLLITNPAYDIATKYFEAWSREVIDRARQRPGTVVFELQGPHVTREEVTAIVEAEKPQLIIFNAHGDKNAILGFHSNVLIRAGENESLLARAIVHALACESGKKLAQECVRVGAVAYIGYKEKFQGAYDTRATTREAMRRDAYAEFIMEPAFEAVLALTEGVTVREAYDRSQEKYRESLRNLMTTPNADSNMTVAGIAQRVFENLSNQVYFGDEHARF